LKGNIKQDILTKAA